MNKQEIEQGEYESWKNNLTDKELLQIFFESFDPDSIEEYLQDEYERKIGKRKEVQE